MDHPLRRLLADVARGAHPPVDGRVTVMPSIDPRLAAVLAFTQHHVVVADVEPEWVRQRLPRGDFAAPLGPPFLAALAQHTGLAVETIDAVLVADAIAAEPSVALRRVPDAELTAHPYRSDVAAWRCDGGLVTLARGLAGRWEVAVEVEPSARNAGLGRTLFTAARRLVAGLGASGPLDSHVWAQVAPGNVASVRALLEAGYRPGGAEALLT